MKPPSIHKIIYYLIALGLILVTIKMYFSQSEMEENMFSEKYGWYYKLEFFGNLLICAGALLSFLVYRKYFPLFLSVCYVSLLLLVTLTSLPDIPSMLSRPNFFFTIRGIGTFANFGLLFFAANTKYFNKIMWLFYAICITFIIAGFINLGKVGMGASRQQFLWAIRDFTVIIIWVFPFFFLQTFENRRLNIINTIIFFIIFIFVLSTGSRSYLIIYLIYLVMKFRHQLRSKNGIFFIIGTIIVGTGVFFFMASSDSLGKTMEGAFDILSERANEDSRSGQIIEFLRQWEPEYFLQGVGPYKTWYWTNFGDYYYFLDNQFLLMGWWAGLPALFIYMYLLFRAFLTKPEINQYKDVQGIQLMVGLWILACLGFAIYITISSSIYYFFLDILMGYHLCKFSKIKDFDPEET